MFYRSQVAQPGKNYVHLSTPILSSIEAVFNTLYQILNTKSIIFFNKKTNLIMKILLRITRYVFYEVDNHFRLQWLHLSRVQ